MPGMAEVADAKLLATLLGQGSASSRSLAVTNG